LVPFAISIGYCLYAKESNISNMASGFAMLGFIILAVNIGIQVASYWIGDYFSMEGSQRFSSPLFFAN
jgi:hypothetical protein